MTPAKAIAMLDRKIAKLGQPVTLRRGMPSTKLDTQAFVRGYRPDELVGTLQQGDQSVTMSPFGLSGVFLSTIPVRGDKIDIAGAQLTIQSSVPVMIGTTMVRLNIVARGS